MGGTVETTDAELEKINAERKRQGKPLLTREQMRKALSDTGNVANPTPGFDWFGFFVGYETGSMFPFTEGAILGSMLHQDQHHDFSSSSSSTTPDSAPACSPPEPVSAPDPAPSYSAPDPSPSYNDSAGFSSSPDSGSSSGGGN